MLYGEVWQYSHGLPIFSIVDAPNLALFILLLSILKLILFFPNYCVEFSAFLAAVPLSKIYFDIA